METDIETKYCQTCGIPLDIDYNNLGGKYECGILRLLFEAWCQGLRFFDGLSDLPLGAFPRRVL